MKRNDVKKLGLAAGIAVVLILLVVGFVSWQQPASEARPQLSAPIPPALPMAEAAPPAAPEEAPAVEQPPEVPEAKPTPPEAPAAKAAPARPKPPKARRRAIARPPPRPVEDAPPPVRPGEGLKVRFKSLAVLERLVTADHVALVLEYVDGTRFMLPREVDGELLALHVPGSNFEGWVSQGRVSELEPTAALKDRFAIHRSDVRYLAVLSAELRDIIAREAGRARVSVERSVMIIDAARDKPMVSVLLPRR